MERTTKTTLYDLLQQFKTEVGRELRVCLPGSILLVNATTGTVDVEISVMQRIFQTGLPLGVPQPYPLLQNCPVISIQGGGVGAIMPIEAGDECLVVFSDRCIDTWFATGETAALPSIRMHDISDGFVLVGLNNSKTNKLLTPLLVDEGGICETQNLTGAKIVVNSGTHLVSVKNASQSLFTSITALTTTITNLISVLSLLGTTGTATAQTVNVATVAALALVQTELTAVQAQFAGLLY